MDTAPPYKANHDGLKTKEYDGEKGSTHQDSDLQPGTTSNLARRLSPRMVQMIAIGGTIGTGLFLGTGNSLATGGPGSMLVSYFIVGIIVFNTMLALGEMAAAFPIAGSFCTFAGRYVDASFGFALTWNYWFNDAVSMASDLVALQLLLEFWHPANFPGWALSLIFLFVLVAMNLITVRAYGEVEYWLSLLKVITIVIFIILGIAVNAGANTSHEYIGTKYFNQNPFKDGIGGFASVFVTASFAYGGTESIAITAGETKNPSKTMPKVIRNVFWRILIFYILSVLIIGLNVPSDYPGLATKDSRTSPFTIVFTQAGSTIAGSFINAVVCTSVLSAGNHALFCGARLLHALALNGHAPRFFARTSKARVPWSAVLGTSVISGLCFGASFIGAGQLWTWLQNLVGVSNQISWVAICITSIRFRRGLKRQGKEGILPFKNPLYPVGPWFCVVLNSVLVLVQGWKSFSPMFKGVDFVSYYIELPVLLLMVVVWKVLKKTHFVGLGEMDLETDRYDIYYTEEEREVAAQEALTGKAVKEKGFKATGKRVGQWLFF